MSYTTGTLSNSEYEAILPISFIAGINSWIRKGMDDDKVRVYLKEGGRSENAINRCDR